MASGQVLHIFETPESLDLASVLRCPDPGDEFRLSAYNADDVENWSEADVSIAVSMIVDVTCGNVCDVIDVLTIPVFHAAFNLIRYYPNLSPSRQVTLCAAFSSFSAKALELLRAIPANPYFTAKDTLDNCTYVELEDKMLTFTNFETQYQCTKRLEELRIGPSHIGSVVRSLVQLVNFLSCMCLKVATSVAPRNLGMAPPSLRVTTSPRRIGSKRRKLQDDATVNLQALDSLVDSMLAISSLDFDTIFSGAYGGAGKPSGPFSRLLLSSICGAMGHVGIEQRAKLAKALCLFARYKLSILLQFNPQLLDLDYLNDSDKGSGLECIGDELEWVTIIAQESKTNHNSCIAECLEMMGDTIIPNLVMKQIITIVKDTWSLQSESAMSSSVQAELLNIGTFIERMAKLVPLSCLNAMDQLRLLFDICSYSLRKSVMEAVKTLIIVARHVDNDQCDSDTARSCAMQREKLLALLQSRQYDSYMYARASLCKAFQDLVKLEALPIRWYTITTDLALERLMDKGSQVRQRALGLLAALVVDVTKRLYRVKLNVPTLKFDLDVINRHLNSIQNLPQEDNIDEITKYLQEHLGLSPSLEKDCISTLCTRLEYANEMYASVLDIAQKVQQAIEIANEMLNSSIETDQKAAIKFIATCHFMDIKAATQGLENVWQLAWSNNQNVIDAVLLEFKRVYFENKDHIAIANGLIEMVSTCTFSIVASIEKIFEINATRQVPPLMHLDKLFVALLKLAVGPSVQVGKDSLPRVALGLCRLIIVCICPSADNAVAQSIRNLDQKKLSCIKNLLQATARVDWCCFAQLCIIVQHGFGNGLAKIAEIAYSLLIASIGSNEPGWFAAAQAVVDLTFAHYVNPELLWQRFISQLLLEILNGARNNIALTQLLFTSGHVAVRTAIAMDKLHTRLKNARNRDSQGAQFNMGMASTNEHEHEIFERMVDQSLVCDNLLGGPIRNLLIAALLDPASLLLNPHPEHLRLLRTAAAISTCKYAAISRQFCNDAPNSNVKGTMLEVILAMLMGGTLHSVQPTGANSVEATPTRLDGSTLEISGQFSSTAQTSTGLQCSLEASLDLGLVEVPASLRSTLIISYGDLLVRHPNLIEPWNNTISQCLEDPQDLVRYTMVMVFTHLVMNDMVKPKALVLGAIMFLVLDPNPKISSCAKTFFTQVHKKNGNAIYNCFPQLLSNLACMRPQFNMAQRMVILTMLLECIEGHRQLESTVGKIAQRLHGMDSGDACAISIYAQALVRINHDEKCLAKLIQALPQIRRLILESNVLLAALLQIARKARQVKNRTAALDESQPETESTNLKDLSLELVSKLHALFGNVKSPHVTSIANQAEHVLSLDISETKPQMNILS
ncbi:bifunctional Armadillo-type fold/Condensin complex subunit 1 [Babesia duncani]|uniref:Bifunctional Armadillo-type fold/Condensin complex subunit 1 n=1 Tax=Babesia duncani TaxID=323732 RepID=A0AAD9PPG2_9APIC|nr:bifunctional Armadillo-type fold/Condensin complex subunit 1 [Babesia duncani]